MRKIGWRSPVSVSCNAKLRFQFRVHKKMRGAALGSQGCCCDLTLPTTPRAGARARAGAGARVCAGMGARVRSRGQARAWAGACVRGQARAFARGDRAFDRGSRRDRVGVRVSSWYPRTIAHDRTPRGVAQKFFMRVYLLVCLVWKKDLEKVVDMPSQQVADCSHATSHRNRWHTNHHRKD